MFIILFRVSKSSCVYHFQKKCFCMFLFSIRFHKCFTISYCENDMKMVPTCVYLFFFRTDKEMPSGHFFRFHRFSLRFCLLCFCSSACNAHSHCELSRMQFCDSRVRLRVRRDAVRIVEDSLKANQASRGVSIQKSTNSNDELSPFF